MKRLIPSAQIERTARGLVHCIAKCSVCEWREESYVGAARAATRHVRETGHDVKVDQGIVYSVRAKRGRP